VQQGQPGLLLDAVGGGVDGVARHQEEVRAGGLEIAGLGGEQVPDQVPAALALISLDLFEVGLGQHEPGTVQATQATGHQLVNGPVVDRRAGPGSAGLLRGVHDQGAAAAETDRLGDCLEEAVAEDLQGGRVARVVVQG
jgi:hypothetical protein